MQLKCYFMQIFDVKAKRKKNIKTKPSFQYLRRNMQAEQKVYEIILVLKAHMRDNSKSHGVHIFLYYFGSLS